MSTHPDFSVASTTSALRLAGAAVAVAALAACGPSDRTESSDGWAADAAGPDAGETGPETSVDSGEGTDPDAADAGGNGGARVPTSEGPVRERRASVGGSIWAFRGVPYAKPPTGSLRWRAPRPPEPRDSVFEADDFGPACPQPTSSTTPGDPGPTDEDCLTLNIWTPSLEDGAQKPVMVWIHGGGFNQGSTRLSYPGGTALYSGRELAKRGVVVVTINYRLGPLGFFAHPDLIGEDPEYAAAGNYGFLDQVRALKWIETNIANFGGDPDQVTLFGESAGGISTCGHLVYEEARGLFDRAIMQSGGCPLFLRWLDQKKRGLESAVTQGERIAKKLGCEGKGLKCLRGVSTGEIFQTLELTFQPFAEGESFGPIVDGEVFERPFWKSVEAGDVADVPLIAGTTEDEGTLFGSAYRGYSKNQYETWVQNNFPNRAAGILKQYPADDYSKPWKAISAILGDVYVTCPTRWALRAHVADGHNGYGYVFSRVTPYGRQNDLGAFHGSELTFVFGNFIRLNVPRDARQLSDHMQSFWTEFAKRGSPGAAGGTDWPTYSLKADELLEFKDPTLGTRADFRKSYCQFWANP